MNKYIIVGGAGFVGSHFTDKLLSNLTTEKITLYDNFSSGRKWHYEHHLNDKRLNVIVGNIEDSSNLEKAMEGHDVAIHLASNPNIAQSAIEPSIDFTQGTALTNGVVEAMRKTGVKRLLYSSGSGVYGDIGEIEGVENMPLSPISTYGASKLSGEALIRSYCYMFNMSACAFRFGNIVGPRQTHGVGFDFIKRLLKDSTQLEILGDGKQSKSYIHVYDVVNAVLLANEKMNKSFDVYNVATGDYITVTEIAELALECLEIDKFNFKYSGGDRGWKADVPIVRLNTNKIKSIGWERTMATKEALKQSILSMLPDIKLGKM